MPCTPWDPSRCFASYSPRPHLTSGILSSSPTLTFQLFIFLCPFITRPLHMLFLSSGLCFCFKGQACAAITVCHASGYPLHQTSEATT